MVDDPRNKTHTARYTERNLCFVSAILVTGGSDNQIFSICIRLQKLGYGITIYSQLPPTKYGSKKDVFIENGIRVRHPPAFLKPVIFALGCLRYFPSMAVQFVCLSPHQRWRLRSYRNIHRRIDEEFCRNIYNFILVFRIRLGNFLEHYRLICAYHSSTYKALYQLRAILGIPVFYTEISSPQFRAENSLAERNTARYINSFDRIFVPSSVIGEELVRCEDLKKPFDVIPFFINLPPFDYQPPKKPARTFGILARLSREKNHDILIRACAEVRKKIPDAQLIFFGNGPQEREYRQLAEDMGLSDCVSFFGPYQRIEDAINRIDIITLCSDVEGMPLSLLEALYFGKPIIATPVGSVPDMVIHNVNGFIVRKHSVSDIADSVISIMCDQELFRNMSRNSRELYATSFDADAQFEKMLGQIENACK